MNFTKKDLNNIYQKAYDGLIYKDDIKLLLEDIKEWVKVVEDTLQAGSIIGFSELAPREDIDQATSDLENADKLVYKFHA